MLSDTQSAFKANGQVCDQPSISLGGRRRERKHHVRVRGCLCPLPLHVLEILVQLINARAGSLDSQGTGIVKLYPQYVARLRKALDLAAGEGTGKELILSGNGEEYEIGLTVHDIEIESNFWELVPEFIREDDVKNLRRIFSSPAT